VIGYWAGWSLTTRSCSKRTIDDIPLDSLTHLNVAFAYITPGTYDIAPMPRTSENIFSQITNLKRKAPGLKIWISLGGWTYSDNGTDTQAVCELLPDLEWDCIIWRCCECVIQSMLTFDAQGANSPATATSAKRSRVT
jgi:hypothetical protein